MERFSRRMGKAAADGALESLRLPIYLLLFAMGFVSALLLMQLYRRLHHRGPDERIEGRGRKHRPAEV
jgi:hypothetical protein